MELPSSTTVLLALVVVAAILGLAVDPSGPAADPHTVVPQVEKAVLELRQALRDPARLSLSFVGALLMDLAYIVALFASVRAFDAPVSVAVEAALIAGLTATGIPTSRRPGRFGGVSREPPKFVLRPGFPQSRAGPHGSRRHCSASQETTTWGSASICHGSWR